MKQTNSTITFLSAQYRAVLKDAYLKGLASTAILSTAALASVYSSTADAATALTDINQLKNSGDYTLDGTLGGGSKDFKVTSKLDWKGDLTVTGGDSSDPYKIRGYGQGSGITGDGTLKLDGQNAVMALGEPEGGYEFKMDIGKIDVNQGELRIRSGYHSGNSVQVSADTINIGSGGIVHIAETENAHGSLTAFGRDHTHKDGASEINLNGGTIIMNGKNAENVVLQGNIKGTGGTISFAEHNQPGTGFNNNGTIKATGTLDNTTIKVGGGRTAVFDFDKAAPTLQGSDTHLKINSGTIQIEGAPAQANAGKVHLKNGTLELGQGAKITNQHKQNALLTIGDGDNDQKAKLKAYWGQVHDFVNATKSSDNHHGTIEIESDGELNLKNKNGSAVHLNNFKFNDKRFMGQIQVHDGATISADKMLVNKALVTGDNPTAGWDLGNALNLKADKLELQEVGKNNVDYNFNKVTVKDVTLKTSGDDSFNLKNTIEFVNTEEVDNPYDASLDKVMAAGSTSIDKNIKLESGGKLHVAAGNVTHQRYVNLAGGELQVGGAENDPASKGIDATLKIKEGMALQNMADTTVKIYGNGVQEIPVNANGDKVNYNSHATLDLTTGKIAIAASKQHKTTFDVKDGTIKLNQENADQLLNANNHRNGSSPMGAAIHLGGNASMVIEGDLNGTKKNGKHQAFSMDRFQKVADAAGVKTDNIGITGTGNTVDAKNMHLKADAIDFGKGNTLIAREGMTIDSATYGKGELDLKSGKLVVGKELNSKNQVENIKVGHEAEVQLGFADRKTDQFGRLTSGGAAGELASHSADTGHLDMNLNLDGLDDKQKAALKVKYGYWTAQDIDASKNAVIEVGSAMEADHTAAPEYGQTGAPVLDAGTVTLADGSRIDVHEHGSLNFDKLTMNGGNVDAKGEMNFDELVMTGGDIESTGNITGKTAKLTDATVTTEKDFNFSGDQASSVNNSTVQAGNDIKFGNELTVTSGVLNAGNDITAGGKFKAGAAPAGTPVNITAGNDINAGELEVDGSRLTAANDVNVDGRLTVKNGGVDAKKNMTVGDDITISSGSISARGTLNGKGDVKQTAGVVSAGVINVEGKYNIAGGAIGGGSDVTVGEKLTVTGGNITVNRDLMAGDYSMSSGTATITRDVKVSGDFALSNGKADFKRDLSVGKDMTVTGGALTVDRHVTVGNDATVENVIVNVKGDFNATQGRVTAANKGNLKVGGAFNFGNVKINSGTITAGGPVTGGNVDMTGGKLEGTGNVEVGNVTMKGGDLIAHKKYSGGDLTMSGGNLTASGDFAGEDISITSGTVTAGGAFSGDILEMAGGKLSSNGDMTVGNTSLTGATVATDGSFTANNFDMSGGTLTAKNDITLNNADLNNGTVTADGKFTGGNVVMNGGSITSSGDFTTTGELDVSNSGTVIAGGKLTSDDIFIDGSTVTAKNDLTSTGYIDVYDSKLDVAGNLSGDRSMIVEGNSTVNVSGAGTVGGRFSLEGGKVDFGGSLAVGDTLRTEAGTLTTKGNITSDNLLMKGGTVSASGDLLLAGNADIESGDLTVGGNASLGGNMTTNGGKTTITNRLDILGDAVLNSGSITAGSAITAGNMQVNGAAVSAGNGLITNQLDVTSGSLNVTGTANVGPLNINGGSMSVTGMLNADDANITAGKLNTSGSMIANSLNMAGGEVNIGTITNVDGSVSSGELTVKNFEMSDGTLNILNSKMTAGKAPIGTSTGDKLQYGFTTTGGDINISGATAKLELGIEALRDLEFNHDIHGNNGNEHPEGWDGGEIDPKNKYLNNISLTDGATIRFNFDDKTVLTKEDIKKLKEEFLKNPDKVPDGNIDIGGALIDKIEDVILPNGDIDWQKLKVFIAENGLDGIKSDNLIGRRLVNIRDGEKVVAHVGSMRVDGDELLLGNGSVNKADGNGGKFLVDTTRNDALIDATLDSGASFEFNNGGKLKDLYLKAGKESDKTNLVIGGDGKVLTEVNKIQGLGKGDYTNVFIEAQTKFSDGIDNIANVAVNAQTEVTNNLTNIDKLEVTDKLNVGGKLENVKDIALASGDVTITGNITGTNTIGAAGSTLTANGGLENVKQIIAHSSELKFNGGGIKNGDKLQLVAKSDLQASGALENIKEIILADSKATLGGGVSNSNSLTMVNGSELSSTGGFDRIKDITMAGSTATVGGAINDTRNFGMIDSTLTANGGMNKVDKITVHNSTANVSGGIVDSDSLALTGNTTLNTQGGLDDVKEVLMAGSKANIGGSITDSKNVLLAGNSKLTTTGGGLDRVEKFEIYGSEADIGGSVNRGDKLAALDSTLKTSGGMSGVKDIGLSNTKATVGGAIDNGDKLTLVNGTQLSVNGNIDYVKQIAMDASSGTVSGSITNANELLAVGNSKLTVNGGLDQIKEIGLSKANVSVTGAITNSDKITVQSGGTLAANGGIKRADDVTFNNASGSFGGEISNVDKFVAANSTITGQAGFDNVKEMAVSGGTVNMGGAFRNIDKLAVTGSGTLTTANGMTGVKELALAGSKATIGKNVRNTDKLIATDGSTIEIKGDARRVQDISLDKSKLTVGGDVYNFDRILAQNGSAINVSGGVTRGDSLTVNSGSTINVAKGIDDVKNVVIEGTAKVGENIDGGDKLAVAQGATLEVGGNILDVDAVSAFGNLKVKGTLQADKLINDPAQGAAFFAAAIPPAGTIEAEALEIGNDSGIGQTDFNGNLKVKGKTVFANQTTLNGDNEFGTVEFTRGGHFAKGKTSADELRLANGVEVRVGSDGKGGSATLFAKHGNLNGGSLVADPEYTEQATIVAMNTVGSKAPTAANTAGEINGTVTALKNSVVAIGTSATDLDGAVKEVQTAFAPYFKDGALQDPANNKNATGAIAYVAKPVTVAQGGKIVVDAGRSYADYKNADSTYRGNVDGNDIYLDRNSALALHNNAVTDKNTAAITFNKKDASIYAREDAKILIAGTSYNPSAPVNLFKDADGKVELVTENNKNLKLESVNGLFTAADGIAPGQVGDVQLTVNREVAAKSYNQISQPVRDALATYGGFADNADRQNVHGDLAQNVSYDASKSQFTDENGKVLAAGKYVAVKNDDGSYSAYHAADNGLLNHVLTATNDGSDAEATVRIASLGGAARTALAASDSLADALAARSGIDAATNPEIVASDSDKGGLTSTQSNGGVWVAPTYRKIDNSGLSADGMDYGNEVELNGITAGAGFRVSSNVEVGAAVSAGKADVTSNGMAAGVSNEAKYFGGAVYARSEHGPVTIAGDVSYTKADNDLTAQTALGAARASVDSEALSAGLTASYAIKAGSVDITPHAGVRFTRLETSDHEVAVSSNQTAKISGDTQNLISVPVGVSVSRNIKQGTWNIKPSLDLTVTANAGDKNTSSEVKWEGVKNMTTNLSTQVVDDVTAGVKAGVSVRNGGFAAGAAVTYKTSDTSDDLAVEANARYDY
ncbi:hypothetical protein [Anaerobiospirillum sp. NML120449]|uniref:hypothetical protein n=1 Tax=Anaerobiospirillum sp. NML120449 TaxID=2932817 RepID=UPI001FF3428D|nr:hypothetical protein [Anaerobiospirillum sp. NML120449]MCK0525812.1 hypothetical protein [Anaerobiospirillum sp. NML120449]